MFKSQIDADLEPVDFDEIKELLSKKQENIEIGKSFNGLHIYIKKLTYDEAEKLCNMLEQSTLTNNKNPYCIADDHYAALKKDTAYDICINTTLKSYKSCSMILLTHAIGIPLHKEMQNLEKCPRNSYVIWRS